MSFNTFKDIFHKLPRTLTQIAFGIGSIDANPDLWKIMQYCRDNDYNRVVPNITINGYRITDDDIRQLVKLCGAVAVSNYSRNACYGTVERLANAGLEQVNIHQVLCEETYDKCFQLLYEKRSDGRLANLNAIVFLILKPKGMRNTFTQLKDPNKYKKLIDYALDKRVAIGFDSCSANSFLKAIEGHAQEKSLTQCAEPCESTCFSVYVDCSGAFYPCSFSVGEPGIKPLYLENGNIFLRDIWHSEQFKQFRDKLHGCGRKCPLFDVEIQ